MSERQTPKLKREVRPPEKHANGFVVMLVASTAMFFAVAGSALILRARMESQCAAARRAAFPPVTVTTTPAAIVDTPKACGGPEFAQAADGTVHIIYTVCPNQQLEVGSPATLPAP